MTVVIGDHRRRLPSVTRTRILLTIGALWLAGIVAVTAWTVANAEHHAAQPAHNQIPGKPGVCLRFEPAGTDPSTGAYHPAQCFESAAATPAVPYQPARAAWLEPDLAHAFAQAAVWTGLAALATGVTLIWTASMRQPQQSTATSEPTPVA